MKREPVNRSAPAAEEELVRWRVRRLLSAGVAASEAVRLGRDRRVDLHALLDLIDRGCPPELAVRITEPD